MNIDHLSISRFCSLAKRGASPGASSGERTANRLAKALDTIGDDMALLDQDAIAGFYALCQLASGPWATDEQKEFVFTCIHKAASP